MGKPETKQKGISLGYCDTETGERVYPAPPPDLLPEQVPPSQGKIKPKDPEKLDKMFANLTSWPPLGQSTVIPVDQKVVHFTVCLETDRASTLKDEDVSVCLWHNHEQSSEWQETSLQLASDHSDTLLVQANQSHARRWYTGELATSSKAGSTTSFTIKFKTNAQHGWKWVRDQTSITDGQIHFAGPLGDHDLGHFFDGISSDIRITNPKCDCPDTLLFSLTTPVKAANGEDSGESSTKLGLPKDSIRWFSLVRLWAPWLAPRQGAGKFELDKDGILVSFLRSDGFHVVCLGISGVRDVTTTLKHDSDGSVIIQGRNDLDEQGTSRVLVAVSASFEVANSAVMYEARKVIQANPETDAETEKEFQALTKDPKPQWFEDWYDGFTYCTWNGLGQKLTEEKINHALDELKKAGIIIENLIIDDNWQSIAEGDTQFQRGWIEFEANKEGFPNGLKQTISDIRSKHPNLRHIAVWHAMMGYWGCISPNGKLAKDYSTDIVDVDMSVITGPMTVISESSIKQMYSDFYAFLSSCGIDSVKTDVQFYLDLLHSAPARRSLITAYQDAWTIASLRHFSARTISCMSQSPSVLFHSQLPINRPTIPVRNSDDFFPDIEASHPWHVFCNAHNSLLTQHLNVVPDWDMFQTRHPWAGFHAAARCVSGGPIYFTDYPGQHDVELINAMTAATPESGRRIILRPHRSGKSISAYAGYKDQALLKAGTYVGFARTGSGILGVFNCLQQAFGEIVRLEDFPGAEQDVEYIVRDYEGAVSSPMTVGLEGKKGGVVKVDLNWRGWAVLSSHPLKTFEQRHGESKVAVLGLVGKMTGIAAVLAYDVYREEVGRIRMWVKLKAVGVLGVYVSSLPSKSVEENVMVLMGGTPLPRENVRVSVHSDQVLEIDYEKLWKEDRERAVKTYTWGNEVSLEVFIS
ncbi:raffinose synthase or seed imbibition protein Sip1-domain-containing protein [Elsinoe ampelina]|uniref:Raffinose synthase or seed imbibition protein Sip1-domain-containing protein n=1 Tax=Elsinoe ampelina TaxID=302913 RepID=A0A6A6GGD9_9PEZI|nr:raffinose synthase or seed imbibition protein Sip1-domain-containing protein [Elsinoe ampelina]